MVCCLALTVALVLPLVLSAAVRAASPSAGDFFEYDSTSNVSNGGQAYYGYTDSLTAHYRYSVESVSGGNVTMLGTGSWHYQDSSGLDQSGTDTYHPVFSLATREYLSGIDVNLTGPVSVWFWVPTDVAVGQVVYVLDEPLTVISLSTTWWQGALPRSVVLLEGSGSYVRDDAYGVYNATYRDQYYYDRATGFVVAETYVEHDVGSWQGMAASFDYSAKISITSSSYALPLDLVTFASIYLAIPAALVLVVVAVIRVRRGPSRIRIGSGNQAVYVRIKRVRAQAELTGLTPNGSPFFGPFLPVLAERSLAEGDPVVLALDERKVMGLALLDRESGMGSLFASEDKVAKVLLKRVRMSDFFADGTIPPQILNAREMDRFTILQLRNPQPADYDSSVVRPMTADDLSTVIWIAQDVYRSHATRFIESSFKAGDLGYVAVANGRVVGFGFATVVGTVARLHTLTVAATERARGLGTELTRARLSALAALGVDRVIVEISKQNTASLRIATKAGFAPVGESIYYSRSPSSAPAALQRQT